MFNIVLYEPEIPPNTGNIMRLASNTGCALHLIAPLGFTLEEKSLRRAGLDYREYRSVTSHDGWKNFCDSERPGRLFAFSTRGTSDYTGAGFREGDYLLFGPETRGLPTAVRNDPAVSAVLRIPMKGASRSLNLSNAVAVAVYEAWRQNGFG